MRQSRTATESHPSNRLLPLLLFCLATAQGQSAAVFARVDPANTTSGYLARLLIDEVPFPGERAYQSEATSQAAMMQILWVLHSRTHLIPKGYAQQHVAGMRTTNIIDVITGTGERRQCEQIVHLAPLSPVANDTWVFWEAGHKLLHFTSDIDLANPVVWQHQTLMVRIFDLDQQVVVTHEEAPGSNRFLTRYQVGRALFNCIVLGQRITVPPYESPAGVPAEASPAQR
ncbi:MAG TPA: hypothetical protein PKM43_09655 [Verrucomicrobiota bacterium]|nr:hypothetical protein [Verrucomicrobiota bacterium]